MADPNDTVMTTDSPPVNQLAGASEIVGNGEGAPKITQDPLATSTDATMLKLEESNLLETKIPAKKDVTLREFLSKMDDHAPIVSKVQYA